MALDQGAEVGIQGRVTRHRRVETLHQGRAQRAGVLDQGHAGLQAQAVEQVARGGTQQLREPGVEGVDRHRAAAGQQPLLQISRLRRQGLGLRLGAAAQDQHRHAASIVGPGQLIQPLVQALAHFARRLAGEGDRQHLVRLGTGQQRAQDA